MTVTITPKITIPVLIAITFTAITTTIIKLKIKKTIGYYLQLSLDLKTNRKAEEKV